MIDLKQIARENLECAKIMLQRTGGLPPTVVLIFDDDVQIVPISFKGEAEKRFKYGLIATVARMTGAIAAVTVNDTFFKTLTTEGANRLENNTRHGRLEEEHNAGSKDVREAITVTVKAPMAASYMLAGFYHRENNSVVFDETVDNYDVEVNMLPDWWDDAGDHKNRSVH